MADNRPLVYTQAMRKGGFTLVETLVAVAILLILATLSVVAVTQYRHRAKLSRVSTDLTAIAAAVTQYAQDNDNQYPADVQRGVPPGLEKYLQGGVWPESAWPHGLFDWDAGPHPVNGQQIYQISYRLCDTGDPAEYCKDRLFPNFTVNSSIYYCISGPCVPHLTDITAPAYCINCPVKKQNY